MKTTSFSTKNSQNLKFITNDMNAKKEKDSKSNYASGQVAISLALIDYLKMLERLRPDLCAVIGARINSEKGRFYYYRRNPDSL